MSLFSQYTCMHNRTLYDLIYVHMYCTCRCSQLMYYQEAVVHEKLSYLPWLNNQLATHTSENTDSLEQLDKAKPVETEGSL